VEPYRRTVRFWDIDVYGHVFNPRYFVYFDDALTDFFAAAGIPFDAERNGGFHFVVAHASCDYRGEATLGDRLATTIRLEEIGRTSITFGFTTVKEPGGELVATGKEVYVVVDAATRRPVPVPGEVRRRFRDL